MICDQRPWFLPAISCSTDHKGPFLGSIENAYCSADYSEDTPGDCTLYPDASCPIEKPEADCTAANLDSCKQISDWKETGSDGDKGAVCLDEYWNYDAARAAQGLEEWHHFTGGDNTTGPGRNASFAVMANLESDGTKKQCHRNGQPCQSTPAIPPAKCCKVSHGQPQSLWIIPAAAVS